MDSWTEKEIKAMQVGGNKQMNDFLASHGVSRKSSIKKKYNSSAAALYREVYIFLYYFNLELLQRLKVENHQLLFLKERMFLKVMSIFWISIDLLFREVNESEDPIQKEIIIYIIT